ncbi:MAG: hypothetical protein PGN24_10475 [Microbacterium arborescens]
MLGEFGTKLETASDRKWLSTLVSYLSRTGMSYAYWSYNPNSGDTGGPRARRLAHPSAGEARRPAAHPYPRSRSPRPRPRPRPPRHPSRRQHPSRPPRPSPPRPPNRPPHPSRRHRRSRPRRRSRHRDALRRRPGSCRAPGARGTWPSSR